MMTDSQLHVGRSPRLWTLLLYCGLATALCGQQHGGAGSGPVRPPAAPRQAEPTAPTVQGPERQGTSTITVSVTRVALDVTVTDPRGKPVGDLKPEDFAVYEDKAPQQIRSFRLEQLQPTTSVLQVPKLPANTFVDLPKGPEGGPPTVILYDLLNTPRDAQAYARQQLVTFLKKRPVNTQVAIFLLTDRLRLLQGFTDDSDLLLAALSGKAAKGNRSTYLQGAGEATQGSDSLTATEGNGNAANAQPDPSFQQIAAMLQHLETMETSYLLDRRVEITAGALQDVAHFLVGQPGRKNLLWLSGSFPAGIVPDPDAGIRDQFQVARNYTKEIVEATDLLTLSHVAVYPVDVRGLQTNPMFSGESRATFEPGQGKDSKAVRSFADAQSSEHTTMDKIAESTGGRAFYNTNGLAEAESAALLDGSIYYALTYRPTNTAADGTLRHVRVEVKRPGVKLAYRRTYFADNLDAKAQDAADHSDDALAAALQHGAPLSHDMFFEAHVVAEGPPVAATPEQVDELLKYESMQGRKAEKALDAAKPVVLQKYVIQYVLLPRQLDIRKGEDELRHDNLDVAAICYDAEGLTLNGIRTKLADAIHNDRWAIMLQEGYHIPLALMVPVGARYLRIAVEDEGNKHLGSLEIALPLAQEPAADGATGH